MARKIEFEHAQVLQSALALFWSKGYQNTTVRDLSAATGLNESSLYNSFGNKHTIFMRTLKLYQQTMSGQMMKLANDHSGREAIERMWRWLAESTTGDTRPGCMLLNAANEIGHEDEAVGNYVVLAYQRLEDMVCDLITKGQQAYEINTTHDARKLARFMVLTFQGLKSSSVLNQAPQHVDEVVDVILSVLD
jgi:TetR/AcrR family transcriptional regulator, transcriptional repressor for nem operon